MTKVAYLGRPELREDAALGPIPDGVTVADELGPDVGFAAVGWGEVDDLAAATALEVVQAPSAGVDWLVPHVPPGVTLCSATGTKDRPVAEWVLGAILADLKSVPALARAQAAGHWERAPQRDLAGLRVLVLGHGSIGRMTAAMLHVFAATVTGVTRSGRDGTHRVEELHDLLPHADVLVNLLPLTGATRGLVGADALRRLPAGALVVNAGRGATTDTAALLAELRAGRLRAALDVTDPEPLPDGHPLWSAPGVMISPHLAGDTPGGELAAWALAGDQLRRWAAGEPLVNVVGAY